MSQIITPQPISRVIDDLEFTTVQFPAFYALGLLPRVAKLGPAFGAPAENGQAVTAPLDASGIQALVLELLRQTSVLVDFGDGKPARKVELTSQEKVNQVFTGRLMSMMKVVAFVIETNFESFVGGSTSVLDAPQLPAA